MLTALGVLMHRDMQRLIARLLLLFAVGGTFVPLAQAMTTAPAHACCLRKAAHHCHNPVSGESALLLLRSTGCCNHDCCRAVTTVRLAHPQLRMTAVSTQIIEPRDPESQPGIPAAVLFDYRSTRAPPAC